jgi:hypothetical protein
VRKLSLSCCCLLLLIWSPRAWGQDQHTFKITALVNLEKLMEGQKAITVDAGGGVSFKIVRGDSELRQKLVVFDRGQEIDELEEGSFSEYARVQSGGSVYWVVSQFTGGAHCCGVYYVLCRPGPGQPLRFLDVTGGHNGGPLALAEAFVSHRGRLYLRSLDDRFDYFHASHAGSLLVNVPATFYHLTPGSMKIDNVPFKDFYLQGATETDGEIHRELAARPGQPAAILDGDNFSDNLGQLLVKRTLYYLYAREDQQAWQTLARDVKKYYRTTKGLLELRREIPEELAKSPY